MRKTKNEHGFTLIEMLIVVAIIAILIAVSIPMVSNALENTRVATDEANERSAKAAALLVYMTYDPADTSTEGKTLAELYKALTGADGVKYDAVNGKLVTVKTSITAYGKCIKQNHLNFEGKECGGHGQQGDSNPAKVLYVKIPSTGSHAGDVIGVWGRGQSYPTGSGAPTLCHILPSTST